MKDKLFVFTWVFILGLALIAAFGVFTLTSDYIAQEKFCVDQGYEGRGNIASITFEDMVYVECIKHDIENGKLALIKEYLPFKEAT